ncbi:hypothetical protein [Afipia felis]
MTGKAPAPSEGWQPYRNSEAMAGSPDADAAALNVSQSCAWLLHFPARLIVRKTMKEHSNV